MFVFDADSLKHSPGGIALEQSKRTYVGSFSEYLFSLKLCK